ncbi:MAG: 2OG-Fe(II) oxygenase [Pseudomonadota bacterium]
MLKSTLTTFADGFLRWRSGRQQTGYEKMLLGINPFIVPWDCYLLRYKEGAEIPSHTDPVDGRKHYRVNVVLSEAEDGGEFECDTPIFASRRIKFFRPDQQPHSVSRVNAGTRYVLSFGWVLKATE